MRNSRREFLRGSALTSFIALTVPDVSEAQTHPVPMQQGQQHPEGQTDSAHLTSGARRTLDLSPASWIWFPSERTLPNTFVLFRRELTLRSQPVRAQGWITADSRYRLTLNGRRIQWGPAPCDPRWVDVDPIDLAAQLNPGLNVLGVEALFYGVGESTWVAGKPGLLCRLEIEYADGRKEQVISDDSWRCYLDRAHRPGQYKRWYLRALQEEFDARLHPHGWNTPEFTPDREWVAAMKIEGLPTSPRCVPNMQTIFGPRKPSVAVERGEGNWQLPATLGTFDSGLCHFRI